MQEVEARPREAGAAAAPATISLTTPAAPRGSRGSSGDSSELEPTASGSVTSGGSSGADESPMDLSSGGATAAVPAMLPGMMAMPITPTTLMHNAALVDHPLLNARKLKAQMLAEFVKAQHLAQQQKANETTPPSAAAAAAAEVSASRMHHPKKRPYTPLPEDAFVDARSGLIPLDLLRAKLELQQERRSPDSGETERNSSNSSTPPSLGPANNVVSSGNNNATSSGREVKKRRLDALLNKKFAVTDSPPSELESSPSPRSMMPQAVSPPMPIAPAAALPPAHHVGNGGGSRRKSSEHQPRKANRRKQSHPQSPPTLSVRPTAELFPQRPLSPSKVSATMMASPLRPLAIPSPSPVERKAENNGCGGGGGEAEALKGQILQLQLMQAALLSASATNPATSDLLKTALGGAATGQQQSLLHYGYFAQMLQNLQSQQTKLVEQLVAGKAGGGGGAPRAEPDPPQLPGRFKFPPTTESILREPPRNHQGLPPPFDLTAAFSPRKSVNGPIFRGSPMGSPSPLSPAMPLGILPSPAGAASAAGDAAGSPSAEPRRRAPRALTGRYVRSGTGASPATLEILRKKILDRMRMKEILGENSHMFFGPLNKQPKHAKNGGLFHRKK